MPRPNGTRRPGDRQRRYGLERAAMEVATGAFPRPAGPGSRGTAVRCRAVVGCRTAGHAPDGWLEITPVPVYSPASRIWVDVSRASR